MRQPSTQFIFNGAMSTVSFVDGQIDGLTDVFLDTTPVSFLIFALVIRLELSSA